MPRSQMIERPMIDWLKRDPRELPAISLGETDLPLVIRRHPRARRMTLRLAPDGSEVRITIPHWGRTADAIDFARDRHEWLARQLAAVPAAEPIGPDTAVRFRGSYLLIEHCSAAARKPRIEPDRLILGGSIDSLQRRIARWLELEALVLLSADLEEYCAKLGKSPPKLALSRAKRRWGSCAPDGTIRINWRLVMAPDHVRRSVVAHEAAHLVHFDHSPGFHDLLKTLFEGDIREANSWLKREGRSLYNQFG